MNNVLWTPSKEEIQSSNLESLRKIINKKFSVDMKNYNDLHQWSVNNIKDFWKVVWDDTNVIYSKKYSDILINKDKMPGSKWFLSSRLNYAENLLKYNNNNTAIEFYNEKQISRKVSYNDLHMQVGKVSNSLKKMGVISGDRVVAIMPNMPESIIGMLASTSIGAIWSSCSPEFGVNGILDRFSQIRPKILLTVDGYYFKGETFDISNKIEKISNSLNTLKHVIVVNYINSQIEYNHVQWEELLNNNNDKIDFEQLPFNHPLYIMYSSGTTGKPKSIVHSSGGTLIQHLKELKYHVNLQQKDKIFYYTTCGWMMWNWLVSSLAFGATIVLYEGNPFYPKPENLLKIMNNIDINIFGTSAKYISHLKNLNIKPYKTGNFKSLKIILSTGSPLTEDMYDFVYNSWKKNVQLSSISGGTDIISCFVLGNPCLPIYRGEIQCIGLGMSVKSYNSDSEHQINCKGELVCDKPFPSMPIFFWNDKDNKKFIKTYFDQNKRVWTHGDFILINERGGVKIFGRSDTTLNPGGIRIGTSEIYQVLDNMSEIHDSLVVGQKWKNDERVVLFIKLVDNIVFNNIIEEKIKSVIKNDCSPRHIPNIIIPIDDIPYTMNGKKVEIAVKNIINGYQVDNKTALSNPESLELYKNIKLLNA